MGGVAGGGLLWLVGPDACGVGWRRWWAVGCGGVLVVCLASCEGLGSDSEGDSSVALFKSPFPRKSNAEETEPL